MVHQPHPPEIYELIEVRDSKVQAHWRQISFGYELSDRQFVQCSIRKVTQKPVIVGFRASTLSPL
ncbi:MAG: hypothetical protein F6J99_41040 [Moorea sp. SIO4G3]|nr:hypothetical protein [Moorena sp. SIO4G3]